MTTRYCKQHGLFGGTNCPKCGATGIQAPMQMTGRPVGKSGGVHRKSIEDQFQRFLIGSLGDEITRSLKRDEIGVMREFYFAGYRTCFEAIQCATNLPDVAMEGIMQAIVEDLVEHYPDSARASHQPGPAETGGSS